MDLQTLSTLDDLLSDVLLDGVHLWFQTHKMNKDYRPLQIPPATILDIIQRRVIVDRRVPEAVKELLEIETIKKLLKSDKELQDFSMHARRYLNIYLPSAGFEISQTDRYSAVTNKSEACVIANRPFEVGFELRYCAGTIANLNEQEEKDLENRTSDFSVIKTSRRGTCLFLGPARFVNHDCDPNCSFMSAGANVIYFKVLKPISVNDEITTHYGDNYFGVGNQECLCATCERLGQGGYKKNKEQAVEPLTSPSLKPLHEGPPSRRLRDRRGKIVSYYPSFSIKPLARQSTSSFSTPSMTPVESDTIPTHSRPQTPVEPSDSTRATQETSRHYPLSTGSSTPLTNHVSSSSQSSSRSASPSRSVMSAMDASQTPHLLAELPEDRQSLQQDQYSMDDSSVEPSTRDISPFNGLDTEESKDCEATLLESMGALRVSELSQGNAQQNSISDTSGVVSSTNDSGEVSDSVLSAQNFRMSIDFLCHNPGRVARPSCDFSSTGVPEAPVGPPEDTEEQRAHLMQSSNSDLLTRRNLSAHATQDCAGSAPVEPLVEQPFQGKDATQVFCTTCKDEVPRHEHGSTSECKRCCRHQAIYGIKWPSRAHQTLADRFRKAEKEAAAKLKAQADAAEIGRAKMRKAQADVLRLEAKVRQDRVKSELRARAEEEKKRAKRQAETLKKQAEMESAQHIQETGQKKAPRKRRPKPPKTLGTQEAEELNPFPYLVHGYPAGKAVLHHSEPAPYPFPDMCNRMPFMYPIPPRDAFPDTMEMPVPCERDMLAPMPAYDGSSEEGLKWPELHPFHLAPYVVWVDPQDESQNFWWLAVTVPREQMDGTMPDLGGSTSVQADPNLIVVRFLEDLTYSVCKIGDLRLFNPGQEPYQQYLQKFGREFKKMTGVKRALQFNKDGESPKGFRWRFMSFNNQQSLVDVEASIQRIQQHYQERQLSFPEPFLSRNGVTWDRFQQNQEFLLHRTQHEQQLAQLAQYQGHVQYGPFGDMRPPPQGVFPLDYQNTAYHSSRAPGFGEGGLMDCPPTSFGHAQSDSASVPRFGYETMPMISQFTTSEHLMQSQGESLLHHGLGADQRIVTPKPKGRPRGSGKKKLEEMRSKGEEPPNGAKSGTKKGAGKSTELEMAADATQTVQALPKKKRVRSKKGTHPDALISTPSPAVQQDMESAILPASAAETYVGKIKKKKKSPIKPQSVHDGQLYVWLPVSHPDHVPKVDVVAVPQSHSIVARVTEVRYRALLGIFSAASDAPDEYSVSGVESSPETTPCRMTPEPCVPYPPTMPWSQSGPEVEGHLISFAVSENAQYNVYSPRDCGTPTSSGTTETDMSIRKGATPGLSEVGESATFSRSGTSEVETLVVESGDGSSEVIDIEGFAEADESDFVDIEELGWQEPIPTPMAVPVKRVKKKSSNKVAVAFKSSKFKAVVPIVLMPGGPEKSASKKKRSKGEDMLLGVPAPLTVRSLPSEEADQPLKTTLEPLVGKNISTATVKPKQSELDRLSEWTIMNSTLEGDGHLTDEGVSTRQGRKRARDQTEKNEWSAKDSKRIPRRSDSTASLSLVVSSSPAALPPLAPKPVPSVLSKSAPNVAPRCASHVPPRAASRAESAPQDAVIDLESNKEIQRLMNWTIKGEGVDFDLESTTRSLRSRRTSIPGQPSAFAQQGSIKHQSQEQGTSTTERDVRSSRDRSSSFTKKSSSTRKIGPGEVSLAVPPTTDSQSDLHADPLDEVRQTRSSSRRSLSEKKDAGESNALHTLASVTDGLNANSNMPLQKGKKVHTTVKTTETPAHKKRKALDDRPDRPLQELLTLAAHTTRKRARQEDEELRTALEISKQDVGQNVIHDGHNGHDGLLPLATDGCALAQQSDVAVPKRGRPRKVRIVVAEDTSVDASTVREEGTVVGEAGVAENAAQKVAIEEVSSISAPEFVSSQDVAASASEEEEENGQDKEQRQDALKSSASQKSEKAVEASTENLEALEPKADCCDKPEGDTRDFLQEQPIQGASAVEAVSTTKSLILERALVLPSQQSLESTEESSADIARSLLLLAGVSKSTKDVADADAAVEADNASADVIADTVVVEAEPPSSVVRRQRSRRWRQEPKVANAVPAKYKVHDTVMAPGELDHMFECEVVGVRKHTKREQGYEIKVHYISYSSRYDVWLDEGVIEEATSSSEHDEDESQE